MDVYEAIRLRKSVRRWQTRDVPEEVLLRLLEAARLAPSARNLQEWRFIAVRDPGTRKQLAQAAKEQAFVGEAPVVLACCADTDHRVMSCGHLCFTIDVAIAVTHLTLAAVSEGLGACWIGAFDEAAVKELLGIPRHVRVVELLPLGYPADAAPAEKDRLPLRDIIMREKWGK